MKSANKTIVPISLNGDQIKMFDQLDIIEHLDCQEIHFVHVFNTVNYSMTFCDFPMASPMQADLKGVEKFVLDFLSKISKKVIPANFKGKVIHKCLFNIDPKFSFCTYADEIYADLIIVPTRQKRGFFESSFAQYVSRYAKANVLILKHQEII